MRFVSTVTLVSLVALAGCTTPKTTSEHVSSKSVDCLARAMYFESNRSSRDGMVAVGSVVMNRVASNDFPDEVCAVVAQPRQFAPGVMTREMSGQSEILARETATSVLQGERHPMTANARFFHARSYVANYNNMHYVVSTGGNAFYEKRPPELVTHSRPPENIEGLTEKLLAR
jgi:spore germination cell wall hydrolase CwlJ-like protein